MCRGSNRRLKAQLEVKEMVIYSKSSIRLKNGFEYEDYILKANESKASYEEICDYLGLTFEQARARYDKVFNLAIEDIGTIESSAVARSVNKLMCAEPKRGTLQTVMTGEVEGLMENSDAMRLITAIFKRAVDDWRMLCNGSKETRDRNFKELEHAFEKELDFYLQASDLKAETIYAKLKKERAKSGLYGG